MYELCLGEVYEWCGVEEYGRLFSDSSASKLGSARGREVERLREKMLSFQKARLPYFKELRVKHLHRVFWQVVILGNIDRIIGLI